MRPWLAHWRNLAAGWERRLLPAECLLCRERVGAEPDEPLVCAVCRARWQRLPHPLCARCGQPVDAYDACRLCGDWPPGFGGVRSAVWLDASARRAVHLFKYEGWWRVAGSLAAAMEGLDALAGEPALIPVPLGAARERARGYNQSAKLAQALSVRLGLPIRHCLVRARDTRSQTRLTPEEREANLRNAFRVTAAPRRAAVLVDDVFTTGATLRAAAEALLAAGAPAVRAVTFGRAELPLAAVAREAAARAGGTA